jgi:hypothetical protein
MSISGGRGRPGRLSPTATALTSRPALPAGPPRQQGRGDHDADPADGPADADPGQGPPFIAVIVREGGNALRLRNHFVLGDARATSRPAGKGLTTRWDIGAAGVRVPRAKSRTKRAGCQAEHSRPADAFKSFARPHLPKLTSVAVGRVCPGNGHRLPATVARAQRSREAASATSHQVMERGRPHLAVAHAVMDRVLSPGPGRLARGAGFGRVPRPNVGPPVGQLAGREWDESAGRVDAVTAQCVSSECEELTRWRDVRPTESRPSSRSRLLVTAARRGPGDFPRARTNGTLWVPAGGAPAVVPTRSRP